MIAVTLPAGRLRDAAVRAARPDEDVICGQELALDALERGFPRLAVTTSEELDFLRRAMARGMAGVPLLALVDSRGARNLARTGESGIVLAILGVDDQPARLSALVRSTAAASYADRILSVFATAAGSSLAIPFCGFARRVLEYPAVYSDLHGVARLTEISVGALKARFRRRGLPSPFTYLRWLRILAAAHLLSRQPEVSIGQAALRLGFSSGPNLCRTVTSITGLSPSALRHSTTLLRLTGRFARLYIAGKRLAVWADLHPLFVRSAG